MRLVLVLALLLPIRDAAACQCLDRPLAATVPEATTVFVGTIVHEDKGDGGFRYTVAVEGVWKGELHASVEVKTGGHPCALYQLRGERWLFVLHDNNPPSMCGGTQPATTAVLDEMRKRFGPPKPPKS